MNEFDKILKSKLDSYTEAPSAEVFQNIRKNYPAKTFAEFVSYNKYYFIAGISAVIITGLLLIMLPEKSKKHELSVQPEISAVKNNVNTEIIPTDENNLNNGSGNTNNYRPYINNSNTIEIQNLAKEIICYDIFKSVDTLVCGNEFEMKLKGSANNYIIPDGLKMIDNNQNISFVCSQSGRYKIIYSELSGEKILTDTISVLFNKSNSLDVKLSNEILCPGEDLLLTIANYSGKPNWANTDLRYQKGEFGIYQISELKPGKNIISFNIVNDNCISKYEKSVNVLQPVTYSYTSSPAVCSQSNATLLINAQNQKPNSYILNNQIISSTGRFENLNAGIYSLTINYANRCQYRDTLLIMDSLNINPYFISERDLVNKNKYYFRNLTKIDDRGYERNSAVIFEWKVNGKLIITDDNTEYEFTRNGNNVVELTAILNETCKSIYSETIYISNSNFRIPNIFTPNGDGIGDEFNVIYDGELAAYQITVINRLGEVVFESDKINHSWNGKINGNDDAGEGLYYYIIRGEDKSENKIEQKGSIQLVRY